jgi:hypothetical protein
MENKMSMQKALFQLKNIVENKPSEDICTYCNDTIYNGPVIFKEGLPSIHSTPCYLEILQQPENVKVIDWKKKMDIIMVTNNGE